MLIPTYLRIPLALDMLLMILERVCPWARHYLPLGGDDVVQLALLVCFGIAAHEIGDSLWGSQRNDDRHDRR